MEEHFKNKLKNHKVDWDKEALLGNLKQELSHDKSSFNRKWFLLLPLLLLGTCWGISDWEFAKGDSISIHDSANENIVDSSAGHKKAETFDSKKQDVKNETKNDFLVEKLDKNQTVKTTDSSFSIKEESESERSKSTLTSTQTASKSPEFVFEKSKDLNFEKKRKLSSIQPNQPIKNNVIAEGFFDNKIGLPQGEKKNQNQLAFLPLLKMEVISNGVGERDIPKEHKVDLDKIIPIKERVDFKNSFFVTGSADVGMVFRKIDFMTENLEIDSPFKSKEKTLIASNFKVGYQHQSGFALESGFEYTEIREFLNADIFLGRDTFIEIDEKASFFLDQNRDTIFIADSTTTIETRTRKVRHNNKHTFLSIPVQVSFRKTRGRTDFFGTVGVSYAFAHNYNGREVLLAEDGNDTVIDDLEFRFKNKIGLQLGVGAEYPIYHQTRGFVNLNYRRTPTLLFFDNTEQFYQSISIGAGVRYSLF